jgi:hypothetical protein
LTIHGKNINLAFYRKEDWKRFLEIIDDKDTVHDTLNKWNKSYLKLKTELSSNGFIVKDIIVDLDELNEYCWSKSLKNTGKARSQFVSNR